MDVRWAATAEQRGGRGEDSEREQPGEHEQAHSRRRDLGENAKADHRTGQPEVRGEEEPRDRLGAALGQGDLRDGLDRALEHQSGSDAGDQIAGEEDPEAR